MDQGFESLRDDAVEGDPPGDELERVDLAAGHQVFEQGQHPRYCTASPVHDPRTGDLLGVVDVSGPALTSHPVISALVETAVRLGESRLWHHHQARLSQLRRSSDHVMAAVDGPVLIVDDHGWVASCAGVAQRDRIAVPQADQAIAVPGLRLCLPERLTDGWLVRPLAAERTIVAELQLGERPLLLELHSGGAPWRTSLTPRHAQVLVALGKARHAGVTAGGLSAALFGDAAHEVTVRAEISRLRRVIGALVGTCPYRLAHGVRLLVRRRDEAPGGA